MKHVCKHPRRLGPHVRAAFAFLKAIGATGIEAVRRKSLRLSWRIGARELAVMLPAASHSGRFAEEMAIQAIRRVFRDAGLPLPLIA